MISIIVPVYKVEKYLPKCIESILAQTYQDIELILIDDGSPDGCPRICDEYAAKDSRIKVIHQKNSGVSAARNAGLEIAQGEYIGFVDPDDFVDSDMYGTMLKALIDSNSDLAICGYDYYDEDYNIDAKRQYAVRENEEITQKELMHRMSDMPPTVRHVTWNKLFKKQNITWRFDEKLHSSEDLLFLEEYCLKVDKAVIVHKPFYKNLVRQGSATHGGLRLCDLADSFEVHNKMYEDIVGLYPDLKKHSLAFLLDVCALKYNEAKRKAGLGNASDEQSLAQMRKYIKKRARQAVFDGEIYWKTRIYYLMI